MAGLKVEESRTGIALPQESCPCPLARHGPVQRRQAKRAGLEQLLVLLYINVHTDVRWLCKSSGKQLLIRAPVYHFFHLDLLVLCFK
jgi:quinolinate synthase